MKIVEFVDTSINSHWCFFDIGRERLRVVDFENNLKALMKLHNIFNLKYAVAGVVDDRDFDIELIKRNCLEKIQNKR